MDSSRPLAPLAATLFLLGALGASSALASSHREAPNISQHPTWDNTDVYAFRSPDKPSTVTLIGNWVPLAAPAGGPNFYSLDDASNGTTFTFNLDTNGDAADDIIYTFYFTTHIRNGNTFLYNTGQVTSPSDPDLNVYQTYSVKKTVHGADTWIGQDILTQPNRVGPKSTPDINDLAEDAIAKLSDGTRVFVGEREDPFFVDLGAVFDLLTIRKLPGDQGEGVDAVSGFNTVTIALQIPIKNVTNDGKDASDTHFPVIGVYSATEHQGKRVSRLGSPLVNEVVIPLKDKDKFNASDPEDDAQFLSYVTNPEAAGLLHALYGISVPPTPRNDLVAAFLTGVPGLNQPANVKPAEMLRLNVSIPPSAHPSRLGVLGGDIAGFPNGRRLADDVVDIELRALAGVLVPGFNISPNNQLGDGVDQNDHAFLREFPYVARPFDPLKKIHQRTEPSNRPGPAAERLGASPADGDDESNIEVESEDYQGLDGQDQEPDQLEIAGANPGNHATLRYSIGHGAHVSLKIFDLQGRVVRTLVDHDLAAGKFDAQWDGLTDTGIRADKGVFFARFAMDNTVVNIKKLVIR